MCNINSFSFLTASGTYAYIETSFPRNYNDTARLISALIPKNSRPGTCISFWYHMYGPDINTLSVYTKSGGSLGSPIWKRTGSQGNKWKYAQVFVRSLLDYQVGFAQRFCQFCSPSSFFFLRNFKRDVMKLRPHPPTQIRRFFVARTIWVLVKTNSEIILFWLACTTDETELLVKSICEPVPKSLFQAAAVCQDLSMCHGWHLL